MLKHTRALKGLDKPDEIELADPEYNISQKIEVLLGASIFFDLIVKGQIKLGRNKPILQRTRLGWIISGSLQIKNPEAHPSCMLSVNNLLNEQLEKFWSIENVTQTKTQFSDEELECESHFRQNYFRDHEGRFVVKLPLKESYKNLGESLNAAISRLESVERKLSKDINLRNQYEEFLNEYEQLGHMSKIDISLDDPNDIKFYLPHHSVIKENSSTTRLRVVFDGSSKTSTNLSLNDVLRVGPTIQNDLVCVLLRMRIPRFVATADISKMYRMVKVHPENRNLQRIVWRSNPSKAIEHFQLNTVTYGTSSASFLATRSLHQVGLDCQAEFPNISDIIINNFYVDDVIFGSDTLSDLIQLKYELSNILQQAGFLLRKWVSNDHRIFENKTDQCSSTIFEIRDSKERKTLGITWNSQQDRFEYSVILNSQCNPTKRTILSAISQIFDPLGLISPVVVNAKIILKELWQAQCDWDAPIPQNILKRWKIFIESLPAINSLVIPRHIAINNAKSFHLHGFCDASEAAYGAAVYIVSQNQNDEILSSLVCSKSRVAPVKVIQLPRLELCGALLLAQLMQKVKDSLHINITSNYCWTDSEIVLAWLRAEPYKWKTFVANRVADIQSLTEATKAVHVELVTELTTESFMSAFRRFVSRRGLCSHIYSDNATNFIGANNELEKIHKLVIDTIKNEQCQSYFSENRITWHFIPAKSPHHGGIWEAAIKSFKYYLKRILGDAKLNFEDMSTVLVQIEAILNSRPLIPLSNDPNDYQSLTPGHFLIGDSLLSIPQSNVIDIPSNRLKHFQRLQQMVQQFWKWWSRDYLHSLQQRSKWQQDSTRSIQLDALVLLKDDSLPPSSWRTGRIEAVHPGNIVYMQCALDDLERWYLERKIRVNPEKTQVKTMGRLLSSPAIKVRIPGREIDWQARIKMSSWCYEEEVRRLQQLFEEVDSDIELAEDSDGSLEEDELLVQEENSDTEQEMSDDDIEEDAAEPETNRSVRIPCFISKDGTRWRKHFTRYPNVRTRSDNIITRLPGVKGLVKEKKTAI
ncbi:uncharacterized protein [Leptinotarsa decemlineata]|uniref:uncharacterized protein n=1 Tax=Leptinotarsa decemlineata TaxID=7539 RepID=UPI003D307876